MIFSEHVVSDASRATIVQCQADREGAQAHVPTAAHKRDDAVLGGFLRDEGSH
jgi:hypothetical protein